MMRALMLGLFLSTLAACSTYPPGPPGHKDGDTGVMRVRVATGVEGTHRLELWLFRSGGYRWLGMKTDSPIRFEHIEFVRGEQRDRLDMPLVRTDVSIDDEGQEWASSSVILPDPVREAACREASHLVIRTTREEDFRVMLDRGGEETTLREILARDR